MSKADKILVQMKNNPLNWRIEDIHTVAVRFGFGVIQGKGSHVKFYHHKLPEILTIPAKRPVKPVYIKHLLQLIDKLEDME